MGPARLDASTSVDISFTETIGRLPAEVVTGVAAEILGEPVPVSALAAATRDEALDTRLSTLLRESLGTTARKISPEHLRIHRPWLSRCRVVAAAGACFSGRGDSARSIDDADCGAGGACRVPVPTF